MHDIVIVPCYERPEYTQVCLEYLSRAVGVQDKEIWLCQDSHIDGLVVDPSNAPEDTRAVAKFFGSTFGNRAVWRGQTAHSYYGNSFNILESMRAAYEAGAERVFIVEDDIMVMPDFFLWSEMVLDVVKPFCTCATSVNKSAHFPINGQYAMDETLKDPQAYYLSKSAYSSHAAAFTRDNLYWLLKHFKNEEYFKPGREQDLITQEYLADLKRPGSAWPYVPRAYNVGLYSYHINTGMKFNGTLEEKCAALRSAITNPEKLRSMSGGNQAITPVPCVDTYFSNLDRLQLYEAKRYR